MEPADLWFHRISKQECKGFIVTNPWGNTPVISFNAHITAIKPDSLLQKAQDYQSMLAISADFIEGAFRTPGMVMPTYLLTHVQAMRDLIALTPLYEDNDENMD